MEPHAHNGRIETRVRSLGPCRYDSPLHIPQFIMENQRVLLEARLEVVREVFKRGDEPVSFDNAGPRPKIFFDPAKTRAAVVTCGGLCPGINNVIQSVVRTLYFRYGVKDILGVPYGYEGLIPDYGHGFVTLRPDVVDDAHEKGGSILGSSRGPQDVARMVDTLLANKIDMLFTIGGDGTLRGSLALTNEIEKRGLPISVVGIPKTIDNDISYVYRTFGFTTAVSIATQAIHAAHAEAKGARNGIGLVKVMGRDSGFIASYVALASNEVNYVFIPEVPFSLEGSNGFLPHLANRLKEKSHAVILVAEGAGQELLKGTGEKDASGNVKYGDVGFFMRDAVQKYLKENKVPFTLKYIDPSYLIRSVPASAEDAVFCIMLAQNAVHAAMAGKTGLLVGLWNSFFTFIPLELAVEKRKKVEPDGYLWSMVREATGQPDFS